VWEDQNWLICSSGKSSVLSPAFSGYGIQRPVPAAKNYEFEGFFFQKEVSANKVGIA
jgi:hypothetical protein